MLTPEQQLVAKKEGWKISNGFPALAYDARGQCPFRTISAIIRFLRQKSKTSDWHRDVYLNLPWTNTDDQMSYEEGWRLTFNEIVLYSTVKFPSNEAAQAHVQTGIDTGDPLHLKAIKALAKRRLLYGDQ